MNRWITALGACAALSALPTGASAHGGYYYDPGDAALGGLVGGVVGGLIGSSIYPYRGYVAPAPVYVAPAAPVIVEPYAPAPVIVAPYPGGAVYGARPGYYYRHGYYYPYRHHHHDDD
jgi:hypothetical protein